MKESSGIMLGLISYFATSLMVFSNIDSSKPLAPAPNKGPLIINIGAPQQATVLDDYLQTHGLEWPLLQTEIPALVVRALPRDMADIKSSKEKKSLFIRTLLPIVLLENHRLAEQRQRLIHFVRQTNSITEEQKYWLGNLLKHYRLTGDINDIQLQKQLLLRLDQLPPSLVLAQAAIESGWGTSRFAQQGNSLFGQWSYQKNSGLVPDARNEGANHMVRAFDSLQESVQAYMRNLNTHGAYKELRLMRSSMRNKEQALDSNALAHGLIRYSQRGEAYVEEVKTIIRGNKFTQYDQMELSQVVVQSKAD